MLPNQPILVSDEEYKKEDKQVFVINGVVHRVIAGLPELPQIDFSALSPKEHATIGYIDVVNLAIKNGCDIKDISGYSFIKGFKTAQSFNEKKFTKEDLKKAIEMAREKEYSWGQPTGNHEHGEDDIIEFLSQPKVFDVEVEIEELFLEEDSLNYTHEKNDISGSKWFPKITDNKIKILKVL